MDVHLFVLRNFCSFFVDYCLYIFMHSFSDIIIRKPKKLYSCGLEYLKAVYGNSEDHDAYKLNFDLKSNFSPIFQDTSYNVKSDHCLSYNIKRNCNDNYDKLSTNNCLFDETKNCDITCNCDSFEPDNYLQFYHGTNEKKYHNPDGILNKTETSSYTVCKNSPEYISLLPPNHKLNSSFLNKLCGKQTSTNVSIILYCYNCYLSFIFKKIYNLAKNFV